MESEEAPRHYGYIWAIGAAIVVIAAFIFVPPLRSLAGRFTDSLRVQKPQSVNVDLSAFVGPNANHSLQQMIQEMIASKVQTTANEQDQRPDSVQAAVTAAGFPVRLLANRKDPPRLLVTGKHAFTITVDRARLQDILTQAGRPELKVPQSVDGAELSVEIPRTVRAQYGTCPGPPSAASDVATPPPPSTQFTDCLVLVEGPLPVANVPQGMDVEPLAEIGLEVAGMNPNQARQFLQTVNWRSTLRLSVPRFMRSYEPVKVDGVQGTLLNTAGRRGPTSVVVWTKDGMAYSLTTYGTSADAVSLANSLK